jgi:hypothetical protein
MVLKDLCTFDSVYIEKFMFALLLVVEMEKIEGRTLAMEGRSRRPRGWIERVFGWIEKYFVPSRTSPIHLRGWIESVF